MVDDVVGAFAGGGIGGLVGAATKNTTAAAYSGAATESLVNEDKR